MDRSRWASHVLIAAAFYNIFWGLFVILFPNWYFQFCGMTPPLYPSLWQGIGMIVGVYGVAYAIAASNPITYWPIVFAGLLGKLFGPIGFLLAVIRHELPPIFGLTLITNDLIWWVPFALICYGAYRELILEDALPKITLSEKQALAEMKFPNGKSVLEHSHGGPILVAFVRHAGCIFCGEFLGELKLAQKQLSSSQTSTVLITTGQTRSLESLCEKYKVTPDAVLSDPSRVWYRAFGLYRGTFSQLFSLQVISRAMSAFLRGHRTGFLQGDGFQMPGYFLVRRGEIVKEMRPENASKQPELNQLCELNTLR